MADDKDTILKYCSDETDKLNTAFGGSDAAAQLAILNETTAVLKQIDVSVGKDATLAAAVKEKRDAFAKLLTQDVALYEKNTKTKFVFTHPFLSYIEVGTKKLNDVFGASTPNVDDEKDALDRANLLLQVIANGVKADPSLESVVKDTREKFKTLIETNTKKWETASKQTYSFTVPSDISGNQAGQQLEAGAQDLGQNIGSWFKGAIDTVSGWFSGKGSSSTSTGAGAGAKPGDDKPFNFGRLAGGGIGLVLGWLVGNGMIGGLFGKIAGVGMAILGMMVGGPAVEKLFGGGDATAKTNTPGKSPTANTHALNNQPAPAPGNNQPTTSPNVLSPEEAHRIYEYAQHLREYAANHQQQSGTDPNPGNVTYVANPNFRPNQRV